MIVTTLLFSGCAATSVTGDSLVNGNDGHLLVQGNIEAKEIDLNSKLAGKIQEIKVKEGDKVKAGDVLIVINSDAIMAKKEQAQALIEAASGQVKAAEAAKEAAVAVAEKAQNGTRPQELAEAKAGFDLAQKTYNRVKSLYESGACSQATFDEASTQYEVYMQQYEMAKQGARSEDKTTANATVEQAESAVEAAKGSLLEARGGLDEVNSYLNDTIIKAPIDGTIASINMEVGELVSTGLALATISNLNEPWVEVNVKETDLSMVKLGQEVTITLLSYLKQHFKGKIVRVNEKPDFATKRATNNNGDFDVLSYGVKIELQNEDKTIYAGMTAIVDFGKRDEQ